MTNLLWFFQLWNALEIIKLTRELNIEEQNVFSSGASLELDKDESLEYLIQIKENIFVEEDETKNCQNYPNAKFVSYGNCDEDFIKKEVRVEIRISHC